jgi:hypothetical protein
MAALQEAQRQGVALTPVEIYPKVDAPHGGVGSPIRFPLGVHRVSGKRYPLISGNGKPLTFAAIVSAALYLQAETLRPGWLTQRYGDLLHPPKRLLPVQGKRTHSRVIRWVDAQVNPLDLLAEFAPDSAMRKTGKGYLGWCPFHDDAAPQADGSLGTPSFSVVWHQGYGWSWRCFSTNCKYEALPMKHPFELFCVLRGVSPAEGITLAVAMWPESR